MYANKKFLANVRNMLFFFPFEDASHSINGSVVQSIVTSPNWISYERKTSQMN